MKRQKEFLKKSNLIKFIILIVSFLLVFLIFKIYINYIDKALNKPIDKPVENVALKEEPKAVILNTPPKSLERIVKNRFKILETDKVHNLDDLIVADKNNYITTLAKYEGNIIILNFWASWCGSSNEEMKSLDKFQKTYQNHKIKVIPVSQDYKGIAVIEEFYRKKNIENLEIFYDYKNKLFNDLKIVAIPQTVIINEQGKELLRINGTVNWQEAIYDPVISKLLPSLN